MSVKSHTSKQQHCCAYLFLYSYFDLNYEMDGESVSGQIKLMIITYM